MKDSSTPTPKLFHPILSSQARSQPAIILPVPESHAKRPLQLDCPRPSVRSVLPQSSEERPRKRKNRTWDLNLSNQLYTRASEYCKQFSKMIETLTVEDFELISPEFDRSPEQCMLRIREILMTGSTAAGVWSKAEDELLTHALEENMNWKDISAYLNSVFHDGMNVRTAKHCKERWNNHLNPNVFKGQWTSHEDLDLMIAFKEHKRKWSQIAKVIDRRNENSVKNRINSLLHREQNATGVSDKEELVQIIIRRLEAELSKK